MSFYNGIKNRFSGSALTARMIIFLWAPYKGIVFLIFVSLLVFTVMEGLSIALIYTVFDQTAQLINHSEVSSKAFAFIKVISSLTGIKDLFILSCILLILASFVKAVFSFVNQFYSFYLSSLIKKDFHEKIFEKFMNAEYPFYFDHKHGWLMHRVMTIPLEASILLDYLPRIAVNFLRIVVIIYTLFFISAPFTTIMIIFSLFYCFVTRIIGKRVSYKLGQDKVNELQRQNELAAEAFTGIKQLKVSQAVKGWIDNFNDSIKKYLRLQVKEGVWVIMPPTLIEFLVIAVLIGFLIAIKITSPGNFTSVLPVIAIFGYAIQRIIPSFNLLGAQIISFSGLLPVLGFAYELLDKREFFRDGHVQFNGFREKIFFNDVDFSYSDREILFKGLTFSIEKGRTTAIVGLSGSGKSTIVDLLVRLLKPSKGEIIVDGIKLDDLEISSWLDKIGLVSQDSFIFHGTIKENISMGLKNVDMAAVTRASIEANCHHFIMEFPDKYDTVVGDRGVKLSGGQKQRVAIARAILRNPEILILDEATSSLDNISEASVQSAIDNTSRGRTVIIIAHRLSTIMNADKIYVIENGNICEEGSHLDLIGKKGFYWRIYNSQISRVEV